jgi:hypothetical protein
MSDPISLPFFKTSEKQPHNHIFLFYATVYDEFNKLDDMCNSQGWIIVKLRDMNQLFHREFIWIPINGLNSQGFVCLMKVPQRHISITWINTSMALLDEITAHQRMKRVIRERYVLGWWIRQISFKKSSLGVEGEFPSSGVTKKDMGKGFGMEAFQSVLRAQKRIQNSP